MRHHHDAADSAGVVSRRLGNVGATASQFGGDGAAGFSTALTAAAADRSHLSQRAGDGRDAIGVFGSGSLTNEKAYTLGKFARTALRTSRIDYNGRFCMASAAKAATAQVAKAKKEAKRAGAEAAKLATKQEELAARLATLQQSADTLVSRREAAAE